MKKTFYTDIGAMILALIFIAGFCIQIGDISQRTKDVSLVYYFIKISAVSLVVSIILTYIICWIIDKLTKKEKK
ncbi:MAG: hypothetical protein ACP5OG_02220 [Candidatus Nanoarchaeia archaeon]